MNYLKKVLVFTVLSCLLFSIYSFKHGAETPHGGIVKHATHGYNIEKVKGVGRMFFYLLENNEIETIRDSSLKGHIEVEFKNGEIEKFELALKNDFETLKIMFKDKRKILHVKVKILYEGKDIVTTF